MPILKKSIKTSAECRMKIIISFICTFYFSLRLIQFFYRLKNKEYKYKKADSAVDFDIIMMAIYLLVL